MVTNNYIKTKYSYFVRFAIVSSVPMLHSATEPIKQSSDTIIKPTEDSMKFGVISLMFSVVSICIITGIHDQIFN